MRRQEGFTLIAAIGKEFAYTGKQSVIKRHVLRCFWILENEQKEINGTHNESLQTSNIESNMWISGNICMLHVTLLTRILPIIERMDTVKVAQANL